MMCINMKKNKKRSINHSKTYVTGWWLIAEVVSSLAYCWCWTKLHVYTFVYVIIDYLFAFSHVSKRHPFHSELSWAKNLCAIFIFRRPQPPEIVFFTDTQSTNWLVVCVEVTLNDFWGECLRISNFWTPFLDFFLVFPRRCFHLFSKLHFCYISSDTCLDLFKVLPNSVHIVY